MAYEAEFPTSHLDPTFTKRSRAFHYCCSTNTTRVEITEFTSTITLIVVGLHGIFFPEALVESHMRLLFFNFSTFWFSLCLLWLGMSKLFYIYKPKVLRNHFKIRAILSLASSVIWGQMAFAILTRFRFSVPPPGFDMIIIYQLVGDLWVIYRIKSHVALLRAKGLLP